MTHEPAPRKGVTSATHLNKNKGKERASDRPTIEIPRSAIEDDDEHGFLDQDLDFFEGSGNAAAFLANLNEVGIARFVQLNS